MDYYIDTDRDYKEYCELLDYLIRHWENEIVEFKAASGQYSTDKIGQYFSAISNEANLHNQQYGWLILGVSENDRREIVGTAFKKGDPQLLGRFKHEIAVNTTDSLTFIDIVELYPVGKSGSPERVLMFKIPAAAVGMPTAWKNRFYARNGDSVSILQQYKIDQIRGQVRRDWSKLIVAEATLSDLDPKAIQLAREKYKEKMNRDHISEDVDSTTDEEFLTQIKLVVGAFL